jgi:hypothetical protein
MGSDPENPAAALAEDEDSATPGVMTKTAFRRFGIVTSLDVTVSSVDTSELGSSQPSCAGTTSVGGPPKRPLGTRVPRALRSNLSMASCSLPRSSVNSCVLPRFVT